MNYKNNKEYVEKQIGNDCEKNDVQSVIERTSQLLRESRRNRQRIENTIQQLNDNFAI